MVVACSPEPNAPTCGDGIQDANEACDDGNRESGDACTPACQIPGTLLECVTLLEGTGYDEVNALLPLDDLSFVAAGSQTTDGREVGWIGRYEDSGEQLWLTWPPPADEWSNSVIDIAVDSSEGYWALLTRGIEQELVYLDSSGQIDARLFLPDVVQPLGFEVSVAQLLVVDHHVWLVGSHSHDLWIGRFDIETQVLSTVLTEDHAGFDDGAWAIARSESEIAIAATVDTSPSYDDDVMLTPHSNVLVIRFDLEGHEVGRNLLGAAEPNIGTQAHSIAADGNDGWVLGGIQRPTGQSFLRNAWVSRIHPGEGWTWTWTNPSTSGASVEDIVATDRAVVAAGHIFAEDERRSWLIGIGLDGVPHWEQNFGEPGYEMSEVSVVVLDSANRLRTANSARNVGAASLLESCIVAW